MIWFDVESCGLHGVPVLLQYARDDSPVILHDIWTRPMIETMEIIDEMMSGDIGGFNIAFDMLHLIKIYTMFALWPDSSAYPEDHIHELGILEEKARFSNICLKPRRALDVMLIARKTKYQSLMERSDIRIRRVPTALAFMLAQELERRIPLEDIYFARRKDKDAPMWKVFDLKRPDGTIHPEFKDVVLSFSASGALKALYRHAFNVKETFFSYRDIEIDKAYYPKELGFAPFAKAIARDVEKTGDWKWTWPQVINHHITHWRWNQDARTYAANDVIYTRRLAVEHFGNPEPGDVDSDLACMVAACRWRGYAIDLGRIKGLKKTALLRLGFPETIAEDLKNRMVKKEHIHKFGKAVIAPRAAKIYLTQVMAEDEVMALGESTKKTKLEEIAGWIGDDDKIHPAAIRAKEILDARTAQKEVELYDKVLIAGRLHASFKVIGTLSSRMAGADGLNPQGIKHSKDVRRAFTLADPENRVLQVIFKDGSYVNVLVPKTTLTGGDFKSFEVSLAAKVFDDPDMTRDLLSGVKVHAIMGAELSGWTYEQVVASDGSKEVDWYSKGKQGFFLKCYFGEAYTFHTKIGVSMEVGERANNNFDRKYPQVKVFQDGVKTAFGALAQAGGLGTKVEWRDPAEYAESFLGFRRYFTLENKVMKALFQLAQDVPPAWRAVKVRVLRRERVQVASGAVSSALYGAAFAVMGSNIRAAGNHYIQSPGAMICKATQHNVWTLQPSGITEWYVQPMNIHDELMVPTKVGYEQAVESKAKETVAFYQKQIPLLAIDWMTGIKSWAGKKGDQDEPATNDPGKDGKSAA